MQPVRRQPGGPGAAERIEDRIARTRSSADAAFRERGRERCKMRLQEGFGGDGPHIAGIGAVER